MMTETLQRIDYEIGVTSFPIASGLEQLFIYGNSTLAKVIRGSGRI